MIPQITAYQTFGGGGGYPLAIAASVNVGAAPVVLVALTTSNGYGYVPSAVYGGQAMTLLARTSTADTGQATTWLWGLTSPPAGTQTISITAPEYCAPATGIAIAIETDASVPFGPTIAGIGEPALTLSVETTAAGCLLVAVGQAQSTAGVPLTASAGTTLIASASEGAAANILSAYSKDAETPGTYSITLTAPFNNVSGAVVALVGADRAIIDLAGIAGTSAAGAPTVAQEQVVDLAGIAGTSAIGALIVSVDGEVRLAGIAGTSAAGAPTVAQEQVVDLAGIAGTSAAGAPTVETYGTFPAVLAPGESIVFRATFAPPAAGSATGALVLATSIGPKSIPLSGTGTAVVDPEPTLKRLSTLGNQFVDPDGNTVRLKTVNWHGSESGNQLPHAMWGGGDVTAFHWTAMPDLIKSWGFNCIRFPFAEDCCADGATPAQSSISTANADLKGISTFDAWEKLFDYCAELGLYIVLDYHRNTPGGGAPPGQFTDKGGWIANWEKIAARFKDHPAVVGADVFNEPYLYEWNIWAGHAEDCGNAIHAIAPDWIIFVEGVMGSGGDTTWWGGHLKGVATRPVVLNVPNKLAYSPHEYGQSVGSQSWLKKDGTDPVNWPDNLYAVWQSFWGFIFEQNIAPIWIGEYGGHFGYNPNTGMSNEPYSTEERQWLANLLIYLNGDFDGSGTSNLTGSEKGMSCSYWCYSPLSGDTGGLVLADHLTPQTGKLALLAPLLED